MAPGARIIVNGNISAASETPGEETVVSDPIDPTVETVPPPAADESPTPETETEQPDNPTPEAG